MACSTYKTLTISFSAPAIPPANGYKVKWRAVGDVDWEEPVNQYGNPVVISGVPACYNIEGTIQADCGDGNLGVPINFGVTSSSAVCYSFTLLNTASYTYVACGSTLPTVVSNDSGTPLTVCAVDGTVTGGYYSKLGICSGSEE